MTIEQNTIRPSAEMTEVFRSLSEVQRREISKQMHEGFAREQQQVETELVALRTEAERLTMKVWSIHNLFPDQPHRWRSDDGRIQEIVAEMEALQGQASDLISLVDYLEKTVRERLA